MEDQDELSAFPNGNVYKGNRGLTMRDAFAMSALQGLISGIDLFEVDDYARRAYEYADAMMRARAKK